VFAKEESTGFSTVKMIRHWFAGGGVLKKKAGVVLVAQGSEHRRN